MDAELRVLAIDNHDSFVHILVDEFRRRSCAVDVYRRTWSTADAVDYVISHRPSLILLSPGPGGPAESRLCLDLLDKFAGEIPIFGVCLGLQCIVHHFGGKVNRADEVVHGKPSAIRHTGQGIFGGLDNPLQVGRYHSLEARSIPPELIVDATYDDCVMAVRHRSFPIWGVQFHPESVLTPNGPQLIGNVLSALETHNAA